MSARVTFPEIYLDIGSYPATLVRWPTTVRNGGMPESSGSGSVNYISNGGGSPGNPQYQRSWNWGGVIYWAVREGQGQIGWPGQ